MSYTISRDEKILHVHATLRSEAEFAAFIDKLVKEYRDFFNTGRCRRRSQ